MEVVLQPSFFFHLFTVNLLGLLLPLSFLLLGRLSSAGYLAALPWTPPPLVLSLIFYLNSPLLYILVSFVVVSALLHSLTGKSALPAKLPGPVSQPRLYAAWIFLCTLQVCVGVGMEGSISAGLNDVATSLVVESGRWSRVLFFLGLHEAVVHWTSTVVKPVVDDTVYGEARKEKWFEKAATAVSFGSLWWWRLRNEAEALVVAADFAGWWLYYVTVAVGIAKIVRSFAWFGRNFVFKKQCKTSSPTHDHEVVVVVEDKV